MRTLLRHFVHFLKACALRVFEVNVFVVCRHVTIEQLKEFHEKYTSAEDMHLGSCWWHVVLKWYFFHKFHGSTFMLKFLQYRTWSLTRACNIASRIRYCSAISRSLLQPSNMATKYLPRNLSRGLWAFEFAMWRTVLSSMHMHLVRDLCWRWQNKQIMILWWHTFCMLDLTEVFVSNRWCACVVILSEQPMEKLRTLLCFDVSILLNATSRFRPRSSPALGRSFSDFFRCIEVSLYTCHWHCFIINYKSQSLTGATHGWVLVWLYKRQKICIS